MDSIEALILGIIQGLTEFLPVSSSGHIELGKALMQVEIKDDLLFSIVVHAATALSTIVVFRKDIWAILSKLFVVAPDKKLNSEQEFSLKILISMLPAGLVWVFAEKQIEQFFEGQVMLVSAMLIITGGLLAFTHYYRQNQSQEPTYWQVLVIGVAQAIAILPGISRSGATIATALLLGVGREQAARLSFLMITPPILGVTALKCLKLLKEPVLDIPTIPLLVGFMVAFVVGLMACKLMIAFVRKGKLLYFAIYCLVVGSSVLVWLFTR